ncbi:MAG: GNAT family N-acetyltransferase [Actinomycetota bacterium]
MRIVSYPEAATPPELRAQVLALHREAWPPEESGEGSESALAHDPTLDPLSMLLVDGDTVLAALDVLTKELVHTGRRYRAGGLSTVVTRQAARGRGHGLRLVMAAREVMAASDLDLGLFTCDRPLQGFYERAGWLVLPRTVIVGGTRGSPFPSDQPGFDKVTLGAFFSPLARSHQRDFHDSRIELYPGEIDKLW